MLSDQKKIIDYMRTKRDEMIMGETDNKGVSENFWR